MHRSILAITSPYVATRSHESRCRAAVPSHLLRPRSSGTASELSVGTLRERVQKPPEEMLCRRECSYHCLALSFWLGMNVVPLHIRYIRSQGSLSQTERTQLCAQSFPCLTSLMSALKPSSMCKIGTLHPKRNYMIFCVT